MKSWTPVRSLIFLSGFVVILSFDVSAQAQGIFWVPAAPISGDIGIDSNLIASGKEQDAFLTNSGGFSGGNPLSDIMLPDGLVFHLAKPLSSSDFSATDTTRTDPQGITWQITSGDSNRYSWTGYSQPGASPQFDMLMDSGGVYSNGGSATGIVTISDLTLGHLYTVQVFQWAADGDPGLITLSGQNSVTLNDGGSTSSPGEVGTGFFVATDPTETFDWAGAGSSYTPLGPISVQDFGEPSVPEPSTYALMFCGMTLLFILHWFRGSRGPR